MVLSLEEIKDKVMSNSRVMIKFSADWCIPCKRIKCVCEGNFKTFNENGIECLEIDIDEEMDFYMLLKRKKMVTSIPSLCYYYGEIDESNWFIPKEIYSGSKMQEVQEFFNKCEKLRE